MINRLKGLGIVLALIGIAFIGAGAFAYLKVQEGTASLQKFSAAQNVTLSYNEDGQLVDRGETAGAEAIMGLLKDDWGYPVVASELDPNDPVVNTASEYMYQMATVAFHTLHGTQTVVLEEDFTAPDGTVYTAGTPYEIPVDGRYWAAFDRSNPIDAAVRAQAWTGVAHALIGELGVGTVTAQALQLGLALAGLFAGVGATFILAGGGLVWASRGAEVPAFETKRASVIA
ncbi:MAG TPA: hypothetical protein VFV59_00450 [Candidatus Limnocylindria bacterium]|nr:hypothetical protein [Candidatus Limnocylindria bacterium]